MLVLSRKLGEQICIGDETQITVLGIQKGRVKLGLVAPPELSIHRQELCLALGCASPQEKESDQASMKKLCGRLKACPLPHG